MIIELSILVCFLIFLVVLLCIPDKCPRCGGRLKDVITDDNHTVYECKDCGEKWISL